MSDWRGRKRLKQILVGLLVCALLLTQSALIPKQRAEAAAKKPTMSSSTKDIVIGGKTGLSIANKVKNSSYQWKSNDKSVASVDKQGNVKGIKKGKAIITCSVKTPQRTYQLKSTVNVRVPAKTITINNPVKEMKVGATYNLNRTITPKTSNDLTTWTSSDPSIAKPDKNGKFKALKEGTVTITAKTLSGKKDSVKIKVVSAKKVKTLTKKDVVDGTIKLSNVSYDIVTIDSSVGEAEIILDHVKIKDSLSMEPNAAYIVRAIDSEIAKVVSLEDTTELVSLAVEDKAAPVAPTFIAEKGTLVVTVDARGNVSVKQEGEAKIGTVTVNRSIDGNISVNLDGFEGNLVVNTISNADIEIVTKNCSIEETTISGTSSGQKLSLSDNTAGGDKSNLGKITVESNAKLKIDVPATQVVISDKVTQANVIIEKPVEKLVNEGKGTQLTINSNVSDIESKGDELTMKVAAGSTVKNIGLTGNKSTVDVALGSKIENVIAKGNDAAITGSGSVVSVQVQGNNSKINTANTKVEVASGASGTVLNGKELNPGATITPPPVQNPSTPYTPSTPTDPSTPTTPTTPVASGSAITIHDPGLIVAGTPVQLTAEETDVTWYVYNYMDDTWGYARISENGLFEPHDTGVVRVVVQSNKNPADYGAVDLTITGRRFVGMDPIAPVEITADESLYDIGKLVSSGKLPTKVNLVYETGNGAETETKEVQLYGGTNWYGTYDGKRTGNYMLKCYIGVPEGYERPNDLYACVVVKVKVPQSGQSIYVRSVDPQDTLTLSTDTHCVKINELVRTYFDGKKVTVHLADQTTREVELSGYYVDSGNQFNGAVPGTYLVKLHASLPDGVLYKHYYQYTTSVNWYSERNMEIPVTVIVAAVQTGEEEEPNEIPDATQPKFVTTATPAAISAVHLNNFPASLPSGDTIDLMQYVSVDTDSPLASDHRIIWTYNGYSNEDILDSINGKMILNRQGTAKIRAISAVDKSKYSEVTVNLVNSKQITGFQPLVPITVDTDRGIYDFRTLYLALENELPATVSGTTDSEETVTTTIRGWSLYSFEEGTMVLLGSADRLDGYDMPSNPRLTVNITVPQTDNRQVVASAQAVQPSITLAEDRYATASQYLMKALFQYERPEDTIPIHVRLQDGTEKDLQCNVFSSYITSKDNLRYKGAVGTYTLHYYISLPIGYKSNSNNGYYDFELSQEINITIDQSPRYERMFVSKQPTKLSYKVGETLDLSGILVMYRDTSEIETDSYVYVGADQFAAKGFELHLDYSSGEKLLLTTPLTLEMDGEYICIYNPANYTSTFFGPISVTE